MKANADMPQGLQLEVLVKRTPNEDARSYTIEFKGTRGFKKLCDGIHIRVIRLAEVKP